MSLFLRFQRRETQKVNGKITRRSALKTALAAGGGALLGSHAPGLLRPYPKNNVILIVADALRADALGARRMMRSQVGASPQDGSITPFLDGLMRRGVSFDNAISPSSWTPTSMGSIFHNVSPLRVYYEGTARAEGSRGSMARDFAQAGYYTGAVVANWVLAQDLFSEGFDDYLVLPQSKHIADRRWACEFPESIKGDPVKEYLWGKPTGERANSLVETLVPRLRRSESFFLYVHYMDNHEVYTLDPELLWKLGSAICYGVTVTNLRNHLVQGKTPIDGEVDFEWAAQRLEEYYDISVSYLDGKLRELFAMLEPEGLLRDTTVIFTSDHGEEFRDAEIESERYFGHASNLSYAQTNTPLVVTSSAFDIAGGAVEAPLSNRDVIAAVKDYVLGGTGSELSDAVRFSAEPAAAPVWSYLDFNDFKGLAYTLGPNRILARLDDKNTVTEVLRARLGADGAVALGQEAAPEIRSGLQSYVEANKGAGGGYMDQRSLDQLRAVGYLN